MKKTVYISVFSIIVLAQWIVPGNMIYQEERALKEGKAYKFRTQPIDPNDPFRGKYIVLNYEINSFKASCETWTGIEDVYVYIEEDENGYARATQVSQNKLDIEDDYVIAAKRSCYQGELRFGFPFTTYYMEESKAYDAELTMRRSQRDSTIQTCYARVYIKGEKAVLDDVFIDDISIAKYVEQH